MNSSIDTLRSLYMLGEQSKERRYDDDATADAEQPAEQTSGGADHEALPGHGRGRLGAVHAATLEPTGKLHAVKNRR